MKVSSLIVVLAIASSAVVSGKFLQQRSTVATQADSLSGLRMQVRQLRAERTSLINVLSEFPASGPLLSGTDVLTGRTTTFDSLTTGLFYLLSPTCPACDANYGYLDSLATIHKVSNILGIVRDSGSDSLAVYVGDRKLAFTVLHSITGYLDHLVPRHGTPITAVIVSGKLLFLISGRISPEEKQEINAILIE
jgi:hypothetical protein